MIGRLGFGARLRAHRERRGISLRSIAESTKIKHSLLEALERGDVSQWPHGLFRRAYLRDYAAAIGLPAEPLLAEFLQLFPEDGAGPAVDVPPAPFRLTLDSPPAIVRVAHRARGAGIEAGALVLAATAAAFVSSWSVLEALGALAIVYYPLAMLTTERAGAWRRLGALTGVVRPHEPAPATQPARLYVVGRQEPEEAFAPAVTDEDFAGSRSALR